MRSRPRDGPRHRARRPCHEFGRAQLGHPTPRVLRLATVRSGTLTTRSDALREISNDHAFPAALHAIRSIDWWAGCSFLAGATPGRIGRHRAEGGVVANRPMA